MEMYILSVYIKVEVRRYLEKNASEIKSKVAAQVVATMQHQHTLFKKLL